MRSSIKVHRGTLLPGYGPRAHAGFPRAKSWTGKEVLAGRSPAASPERPGRAGVGACAASERRLHQKRHKARLHTVGMRAAGAVVGLASITSLWFKRPRLSSRVGGGVALVQDGGMRGPSWRTGRSWWMRPSGGGWMANCPARGVPVPVTRPGRVGTCDLARPTY